MLVPGQRLQHPAACSAFHESRVGISTSGRGSTFLAPPPPVSPASCVAALGHGRGTRFPWPHNFWLAPRRSWCCFVVATSSPFPSTEVVAAEFLLHPSGWPGRLPVLLCRLTGTLPVVHPERPFHPQGCPQRGLGRACLRGRGPGWSGAGE